MAKTVKNCRKAMDPARVEAMMRMLPRETLLKIKNARPPKPKIRPGRPISRSIEGERLDGGRLVHARTSPAGSFTCAFVTAET